MQRLVVYTLQNKGSYNPVNEVAAFQKVVYTLQNKGSYNLFIDNKWQL